MNRFWEAFIKPALAIHQPAVVVEIGAESGKNTERLLEFCTEHDAVLHAIDPEPKFDVDAWQAEYGPRFTFHKERSLTALATIGPADAVLIDGDHNWYTVYHELSLIDRAARDHHRDFPLVFLHDIGWPYGRRDLYYNPDDIPEEYRQPCRRHGMHPGESDLHVIGGLNPHLCNASHEGGERNGVLTAVEDFLRDMGDRLEFEQLPGLQGLGVIFPMEEPTGATPLRDFLRSVANSPALTPFIEAMERDRIRLHIRSTELAQVLDADRLRAKDQARRLTEATRLRKRAESRAQELAQRHADLEQRQPENERMRQELDDLKNERALLTTQLAREREVLRAELAVERKLLRAEWASEQERLLAEIASVSAQAAAAQSAKEETLAERDRLRAELAEQRAETEKREKTRDREDQEQLARLQATIQKIIARDIKNARHLMHAGQRLAQVNALLARALERQSSKKTNRLLVAAQEDLFALRDALDILSHGEEPGRQAASATPAGVPAAGENGRASAADLGRRGRADIVVCVHDALDDVKRCLASVQRHTDLEHRVILVDDGSDAECAAFLREIERADSRFTLLRNEERTGYTKAANRGLRAATAEVVVLLNSDTIVTPRWLQRLLACVESDPTIGIVGPLSNAASYQSVPRRFDGDGRWASNPLPPGWTVDHVAAAVSTLSERAFPRVPFVNGFCFAVKRAVIDAIGYFDEEAFPDAFGEENDYCLRAADAGFVLAIADHAYVYHAKSRSYSPEQRHSLGRLAKRLLRQRHGLERFEAGEALLRDEPTMARMRSELAAALASVRPTKEAPNILFVLPVGGGFGGAHSVVQEAAGMRRLGIDAQVAVHAKHLALYHANYPSLASEQLFFGFPTRDDLIAHAAGFDVAVGTIHTSMSLVAAIVAEHPWVIPAYYVQDYEPFFFPEDSPGRETAARSYTLVPDTVLFAKTRWLCDTVQTLHGVETHQVSPSIDHDVYFPPPARRRRTRVRVAAMIRPSSPRRAAGRTIEVLRRLAREHGKQIEIHIFGSTDVELSAAGLEADFPLTNHGILTREKVADVLRDADVFLDLSDYQAFGRTGLEAMACGCAVVVPALGGAGEYAVDGENALVVDTSQPEACFAAARDLVTGRELRERLQKTALTTASQYSIERAARDEFELLNSIVALRKSSGDDLLIGGTARPLTLATSGPPDSGSG